MKKKPKDEQVDFLHDLVKCAVRALVEHEDQVRILVDVTPARVVFSVFVAPSDTGLALGNDGANVDAIRRIMWTACKKTDYKCELDIVTGGHRRDYGT